MPARPSDIPGAGWKDILWRVLWALPQDRVLTTAGGVAFFALLAVFPGLVAVVSIYGVFSDPAVISQHVGLLTYILPTAALDLLAEQLVRIAERSTGSLGLTSTISLLIALWSANSGVSALFDALNVIYREREDRTLVRFYATTFLFTLGGGRVSPPDDQRRRPPSRDPGAGRVRGDWPTRSCPWRGGRSSWSW